jgi:hypothetical protein
MLSMSLVVSGIGVPWKRFAQPLVTGASNTTIADFHRMVVGLLDFGHGALLSDGALLGIVPRIPTDEAGHYEAGGDEFEDLARRPCLNRPEHQGTKGEAVTGADTFFSYQATNARQASI